ncbi:hypothetical protein BS17DRAFT_771795 [Gyrodon lividus]|nr:hypothetical protein BS17DRAFT_771795 [Gyrodon lividus]
MTTRSVANNVRRRQDVIPEEDDYRAMPHSLRRVFTPSRECSESSTRPRSILFEPAVSQTLQTASVPSSPYSKPRWSPVSDHFPNGGVFRARQSVSSIGSYSTVQTRSAVPVKSILTRHDSGISMATTNKPTRRKKRSPPSVKFVDAPTVYYDHGVYPDVPPPRSPSSPTSVRRKMKPSRWFTRWWKRSPSPPPRPVISGPYHLSYTTSLADVYGSRSPKSGSGRLTQLWIRVTSVVR